MATPHWIMILVLTTQPPSLPDIVAGNTQDRGDRVSAFEVKAVRFGIKEAFQAGNDCKRTTRITEPNVVSQRKDSLVVSVIITDGHIAVMDPAVLLLEPLLQYRSRRFVPGGPLGYQQVEETVSLCDFDNKDRLCFSAGLWPRVRRTLQKHGYRVQVEDQRTPGPRLIVDDGVLDDADDGIKPLLQAVVHEPLGQIEAATDQDVVNRMLLISEVFPEARVVVAVATRRQAWSLWRKLKEYLAGTVGLTLLRVEQTGKRWLVGTFGSIPRARAGDYDILLLPSAEEVVGTRAIEMVVGMHFRRIYAFIRPQRRPDRLVQIRLEQMAGPIIHRVKMPRVPVQVLMMPTLACNVVGAVTALERKRGLYWHNIARNDHVAAVAQAVVGGERAALKAVGLRNKDIRRIWDLNNKRVAVLVESPEHGRELLAWLPGWRMLDLVPSIMPITDGESALRTKMPAVVTLAYAATQSIRADIIIRATGTGWALRMKGFPPRQTKKSPVEVLVIDLVDEFSHDAQKDTRCRVQEYERHGMRVTFLKVREQGNKESNSSGRPDLATQGGAGPKGQFSDQA